MAVVGGCGVREGAGVAVGVSNGNGVVVVAEGAAVSLASMDSACGVWVGLGVIVGSSTVAGVELIWSTMVGVGRVG